MALTHMKIIHAAISAVAIPAWVGSSMDASTKCIRQCIDRSAAALNRCFSRQVGFAVPIPLPCYTFAVRSLHRFTLAIIASLAIAAPAFGQSGVTIAVDQFGVGNSFRAGEITAVRLQLTSNLSGPTPIWVQWQVPNCDGDIAEYGRSLGAITPNTPTYIWLYAYLPPDTNMQTVWTVRVFEERDGVRRGEVGGARINSGPGSQQVDISAGMI